MHTIAAAMTCLLMLLSQSASAAPCGAGDGATRVVLGASARTAQEAGQGGGFETRLGVSWRGCDDAGWSVDVATGSEVAATTVGAEGWALDLGEAGLAPARFSQTVVAWRDGDDALSGRLVEALVGRHQLFGGALSGTHGGVSVSLTGAAYRGDSVVDAQVAWALTEDLNVAVEGRRLNLAGAETTGVSLGAEWSDGDRRFGVGLGLVAVESGEAVGAALKVGREAGVAMEVGVVTSGRRTAARAKLSVAPIGLRLEAGYGDEGAAARPTAIDALTMQAAPSDGGAPAGWVRVEADLTRLF